MITDFKLISTEVESNFKVYYHFPAGNDNELTVPIISKLIIDLVTQFIDKSY